jgi:ariadne-1
MRSRSSWIDVQFIKAATLGLMEARNMLKWTYVYGYFLPDQVNRDLFEYLQADLESATERLSGLLEDKGEKDRLKIINATEYVKQVSPIILQPF